MKPCRVLHVLGLALLVALVRGEEVITVRGDTKLQPGDVVVAFTKVQHERALKRALTGE